MKSMAVKATEREIVALGVKAKGYASNAADFAQTAGSCQLRLRKNLVL
jgi:hypothetical protein